jgi:outer membrane receptor for ferric coprogen and ferric-rhodotorulic acid
VFAPNPYRTEPTDAEIRYANTENRLATSRQLGAYGALRLQLSDPLKLVVGGRAASYRTIWDTTVTTLGVATPSSTLQDNNRFMPFAGLIYAVNPSWSAYASYADIFNPQWSLDAAGQNLKPIQGATYEIGLKGELFGGRANTSFALYRVDQKNRATEDLASGANCRDGYYCYTDDGRVRSQGFDAEISGELAAAGTCLPATPSTATPTSATSTTRDRTSTPTRPSTCCVPGPPTSCPAHGVPSPGGGVNAQSASYRKVGTVSIQAPGRAVWSSYVRYQINKQWQASLNFNNMFDKRYYTSIGNLVNSSHYGDPRNVMLTLRGTSDQRQHATCTSPPGQRPPCGLFQQCRAFTSRAPRTAMTAITGIRCDCHMIQRRVRRTASSGGRLPSACKALAQRRKSCVGLRTSAPPDKQRHLQVEQRLADIPAHALGAPQHRATPVSSSTTAAMP